MRREQGGVQPVVRLGERRGTVGRELLTKLRVSRAGVLILRHEQVANAMLRGNVVVQLLVEHDGGSVQMGIETLVLSRQIIILFFVHLLVDDILLSHAQGTAGALLVDLRSSTRRLNPGL